MKSKIVKNIKFDNICLEKKIRKENLNKIYNTIYISNNKEEEKLLYLYTTTIILILQTCFLIYKLQKNLNKVSKKIDFNRKSIS